MTPEMRNLTSALLSYASAAPSSEGGGEPEVATGASRYPGPEGLRLCSWTDSGPALDVPQIRQCFEKMIKIKTLSS